MNETRDAMHLLASCKWVEMARNACAINISPNAKGLGSFPTVPNVWGRFTVEPNEAKAGQFPNCPPHFVRWPLRPLLQQLPNKAVAKGSLHRRRRNDGGLFQAQSVQTGLKQ